MIGPSDAFIWGSGGAQLTPTQIDAQRKVAQAMMAQGSDYSPVQSWTQGAARVAQAMFGGMMARDANEAVKTNQAAEAQLLSSVLGGTPSSSSISTAPASVSTPMGRTSIPASTNGKIYSNDEPSPLDPPSGADRDAAIRTVLAEAGDQGPVGLNAVASVIRNRAVNGGFGGDTPSGVVTAPNQFEPWNTAAGRSRMAAIDPNGDQYAAAGNALDLAYAGNDPTNGATMFYGPKTQAALGRRPPSWDDGTGVDIGGHRFFGGAPQTTQVAQADDPAALPANSQPTQGFAIPGAQPAAGVNPAIARAMASPYVSDGTKKILGLVLTQQMKAAQQAADPLRNLQIQEARTKLTPLGAPTMDDQGNLVQRDALGKVTVLKPSANAPSSVAEYNFYADQESKAGRTPLPYGQWFTQLKRAGATNVNTGTIPKGFEQYTDPLTGAVRLREIPVDPTKKDQAKADSQATSSDVITNAATNIRDAIKSSNLPATGTAGAVLSNIGETGAAEVARQMAVLKSNATIENLNAMRAQSPTGGALGNVTEGEGAMLAARAGALDMKSPHFLRDLADYERTLLRTIHGKTEGDRIFDATRKPEPQSQGVAEGATAFNPQTGERLIRKGGKWVPFT